MPDTPTIADLIIELRAIRQTLAQKRPLLLDAQEAAAYLGVSRSGFYRLTATPGFPASVDASGPRWKRADLERWAERLRPTRKGSRRTTTMTEN